MNVVMRTNSSWIFSLLRNHHDRFLFFRMDRALVFYSYNSLSIFPALGKALSTLKFVYFISVESNLI